MAQDPSKAKSEPKTVDSKNATAIKEFVENSWTGDSGIQVQLENFIKIPNQSPSYDADYTTNGYQEEACGLLADWVLAQNVTGLTMKVFENGVEVPWPKEETTSKSAVTTAKDTATTAAKDAAKAVKNYVNEKLGKKTGDDSKSEEKKSEKKEDDVTTTTTTENESSSTPTTPFIFIEIAASDADLYSHTILMYGHFDKQPPMEEEWDSELGGPTDPVVVDGKLYGRGGADDGYSVFASINCIQALQSQNMAHPRIVMLVEGCEESGSPDLEYYRNLLTDDIGDVNYVICLDSGCLSYDQLFVTMSLRGFVVVDLKTEILTESIHSGMSGFIRDTFHVTRALLDRIDDVNDSEYGGKMIDGLQVEIPEKHIEYADAIANTIGDQLVTDYPLIDGCEPQINTSSSETALRELLLNKTWRSQLCITGIKDMPNTWETAGNVLRQNTNTRLSIRLPPTLGPVAAYLAINSAIKSSPIPYNAQVTVTFETGAKGFEAPELHSWLETALQDASHTYFGENKDCLFYGEGGTIPLMGDLQELFPTAQFIVTGVLGPGANAHGPNECLDIAFCQKLTMCMAHMTNLIALNHNITETASVSVKTKTKTTTATTKQVKKDEKKENVPKMNTRPNITNFMD